MITKSLCCLSAVLSLIGAGCQREHDHAETGHTRNGGAHGHSHGDDAGSFSGATHKEGEGITLLDETCKLLELKTEEVNQRLMSREIRFSAHLLDGVAATTGARGQRLAVG